MNIIVNFGNLEYNLQLNRRVTIIQGDSGTGKSCLYEIISEKDLDNTTTIQSPKKVISLPIMITDRNSTKKFLKKNTNNIIVIDELCTYENYNYLVSDQQLMEDILKYNVWYIIISRDIKTIKGLSHSPKEIYEICELQEYTSGNKIVRTLKPKYDLSKVNSKRFKELKTEDSGSGLKFFENLGIPTNEIKGGSSGVEKELFEGKLHNKAVIVDLGNFKYTFESLYNEALLGNLDIIERECFEEQVLKSSLITTNSVLNEKLAEHLNKINSTDYLTWERCYEKGLELIMRTISNDQNFKYKKSWDNFPKCFKIPCSECQDKNDCNYTNFNIKDKGLDILEQNDLGYLLNKESRKEIKSIEF